jgi:hypothetical protein
METVAVNVQRKTRNASTLEDDLKVARFIATLLDSQFEIAGIKFGLDAIVGLVPGVGDLIIGLVGCYPIHLAKKHNLGKAIQVRMAWNLIADWAVGSVPVVGDVFDVAFKANLKNLALLEMAVEKRNAGTSMV